MIVCDTPESIEFFQLCSMRGRLQLELKGIRFRVPTLPAVNRKLGTHYRRKQQALDHLEREIAEKSKPITEDPA